MTPSVTLSENAPENGNRTVKNKAGLSKPANFQEIIDGVSKEELWKFIQEGMKADPQLKNRFLVHFAEYATEKDPQKKYRTLIKSCYNQALQRSGYGYIDYYSAAIFTRPLYKLNEKADQLLASGKIQESLAICKSLIEEVSGVIDTIDDSDGGAGNVITFSFDTLSKMIAETGFKEKEELFDWCLQEYSKTKYGDFGFEHHFLELMPGLVVNPEQEERFLNLIDKKVDIVNESNYSEYGMKMLVRAKIDYFKFNGKDKEAEELINRYSHIEKGYSERLLRLARLNSNDIRFIRQYAGHLADDYPEEILTFYENAIKSFAEQTGRKYYREASRYLKEMSEMEGGNDKACLLCKELLQTYNNRPAMKDEFRKKFPGWV